MRRRHQNARRKRRFGQAMTEYIIIVALIAIASIAIVTIFGNQIRELFRASAKQLAGDTTAQPRDQTTEADQHVQKQLNKF